MIFSLFVAQLIVGILLIGTFLLFISSRKVKNGRSFQATFYSKKVWIIAILAFASLQIAILVYLLFFRGSSFGVVTSITNAKNVDNVIVLGKSLRENVFVTSSRVCLTMVDITKKEEEKIRDAGWSIEKVENVNEVFKMTKFEKLVFFDEGPTIVTSDLWELFGYRPDSLQIYAPEELDSTKRKRGRIEDSVSSRVVFFRPSKKLHKKAVSFFTQERSFGEGLKNMKKDIGVGIEWGKLSVLYQFHQEIPNANPMVLNSALSLGIKVFVFDQVNPSEKDVNDEDSNVKTLKRWWKGILDGTKNSKFPLSPSSLSSHYGESVVKGLIRDDWANEIRPGPYDLTESGVEIVGRGEVFFPRLIEEMKNAKSSVHVVTFGFLYGSIIRQIADAMIQVAKRGKSAKVTVSEYGSYIYPTCGYPSCCEDWWGWMTDNGVVVTSNDGNPLSHWNDYDGIIGEERWYDPSGDELMQFEHRKMIIIDGEIAWVGGLGFEDHFFDASDYMVRLKGEIVHQVQEAFLWSFAKLGGRIRMNIWDIQNYYAPYDVKDTTKVQLVHQAKAYPSEIKDKYVDVIGNAKKEIIFAMSEFGDYGILQELCAAVRRGVEITMIVPEHSRLCVKYVQVSLYNSLIDCGIKLFEYNPGELHSKLIIIDSNKVYGGSANTNGPGLYYNLEANIYIEDEAKTKAYIDDLRKDTLDPSKRTRITKDYNNKLSIWERIRNKLTWYLDYFLHMELPCGLDVSQVCDAFVDDDRYARWKRGEMEPLGENLKRL